MNNDENNDKMINTEEPLEVSEKELNMLLERSKRAKEGKIHSQEEVKIFFDTLLDDYKVPPSNKRTTLTKEDGYKKSGIIS